MAVLGDEEFVLGFKLAGVKVARTCENAEETRRALEEFRGMNDIAVLLIQRKYARMVGEYLHEWKSKKDIYPVIVELPGYGEREEVEDPMREVIRRAIGIDIMKR